MSLLIKSAGLIPGEIKKDAMEIMIADARLFFMVGGVLNLQEWSELDANEKLAFYTARESFPKDEDEKIILNNHVDKMIAILNRN